MKTRAAPWAQIGRVAHYLEAVVVLTVLPEEVMAQLKAATHLREVAVTVLGVVSEASLLPLAGVADEVEGMAGRRHKV